MSFQPAGFLLTAGHLLIRTTDRLENVAPYACFWKHCTFVRGLEVRIGIWVSAHSPAMDELAGFTEQAGENIRIDGGSKPVGNDSSGGDFGMGE